MERIIFTLTVLFISGIDAQQQCECQEYNLGGIIAGCIIGTLALVGIIILIIFLVWRKKQRRSASDTAQKSGKKGYDNPALTSDVEAATTSTNNNGTSAADFKTKGFGGYVECREYTSPKKDKKVTGANGSAGVHYKLSPDFPGKALVKAGSHGSLDDAAFPGQGEAVVVPLHSQDIIGLGFNISGNISDGIYVSQVHNRGPAKESGLIKQGDRIMGVFISFENMVHEDALTILSYAAPYPVSLTLLKPRKQPKEDVKLATEEAETDAEVALTHPIYRSQSYDDVTKINIDADRWIGPRRTYSEMKKGQHPMKKQQSLEEDAAGKLKKWGATHNITFPDDAAPQYEAEDNNTAQYTVEAELNTSSNPADLSIESATGIDLDELNQTSMLDGLSEQDRLDMMRLSYEDPEKAKEELREFRKQQEQEAEDKVDDVTQNLEDDVPELLDGTDETVDRLQQKIDIEGAIEDGLPVVENVRMEQVLEVNAEKPLSNLPIATSVDSGDVRVDIPDILEKQDSPKVEMELQPIQNINVESGNVDVEMNDNVNILPTVTLETETDKVVGLRKMSSSGSVSSLSSSDSSAKDDDITDINKNDMTKLDANPALSDLHVPEVQVQVPEVELEANGANLEDSLDMEMVEKSIESQLIMSESPESKDLADASMFVNTSMADDLRVQGEDKEEVEELGDDEEQHNMVRSVLKDYFGDKPSLLEQFGFGGEEGNEEVEEEEVEEEAPVVQTKGGLAFEINDDTLKHAPLPPVPDTDTPKAKPKGGLAYYVAMDDQESASLTAPVYYEPPLNNDNDSSLVITSSTTDMDRSATPDLFASDKVQDITSLKMDAL